ncbi:MAG: hypothetical protein XE10_1226 [Methanoculleus marisnigri]|uniref:Uncharacterized protein n=1 Tax=Methanoculleus marisnigri TaxID=2198 RepID=A0A117MFB8_9EURY|nr:MAG: hypothetical protein XE10_1226 [Methanoculleus marisnigri]
MIYCPLRKVYQIAGKNALEYRGTAVTPVPTPVRQVTSTGGGYGPVDLSGAAFHKTP